MIQSTGSWKNLSLLATIVCLPSGAQPQLFLKSQPGAVNGLAVIMYVKQLRRHLLRRKLLLFWDGLPAHRATSVQRFLKTQRSWLNVQRIPAYAPELNPTEYLWSAMKAKAVCNLRPEGLSPLKQAVRRGYRRIRKNKHLLDGFLNASGLF